MSIRNRRKKNNEGMVKRKKSVNKSSIVSKRVDERFWRLAIESARRQPRLAFYSPIASAVLNYWKNIIPRFSMSDLLAKIIEKEIASRWPQLYDRARKSLSVKKGGK
jgi:hypothetical protein